jgi:transposase-like protein
MEQLIAQARSQGPQLTKTVLESALEGEITDHPGYDNHVPAGKEGGNSPGEPRAAAGL